MNSINKRKMRKGDLKNGKTFTHYSRGKEEVLEVVKEYGNTTLRNKKMFAGHVTNITNEGFDVTIFLAGLEVKSRIEFKNCMISY